ncbi:lipoprotein-releasing system transmembrane subunit LolC, partial [bacterium]|nr:lipoprotein-releasing system transmembrane subunit LolC [bacterium]
MNQRFSWFVALRYVRPFQQRGLSRFLALASLLGLVLGVSSLIVVVSVMNGFELELRKRLLSLIPHAQLEVEGGVTQWREAATQLRQAEGVEGVAPYIEQTVLVAAGGRYLPVMVLGVDPAQEQSVSVLPERIVAGDLATLAEQPYGIVIGRLLAQQLRVMPGDKVHIVLPRVHMTLLGPMTRERQFTVAAVFEVGAQLDRDLAMINLSTAATLVAAGDRVDGLRLRVDDMFTAGDTASKAVRE